MRPIWPVLAALVFTVLAPGAARSQTPTPVQRFETAVRAATEGKSIGLAVAVTHGGEVVYARTFGPANAELAQPLTLDSLWTPSVISAYYSAAAAARLIDEGVLAVDTPIAKYWPELHPLVGRITLRQLFQNRGGIVDEHVNYALLDSGALAAWALKCQESCIIAEPGYIQSFSSRSPNLAAAVVEHVAKTPFADLLDARVFAPLQFTRTSLSILKVATQPIAFGHRTTSEGLAVVRPLAMNWVGWPGTSVFTSMNEAITFAGVLVNGGQWKGREVFAPAVVRQTLALLPPEDASGALVSNTSWAGVRASSALVPDKRFAVVVFTNTPTTADVLTTLVSAARGSWLGETGTTAATDAASPAATPVSEAEARELAGVYRNEYQISLEWRAGTLKFRDDGTSYRQPGPWIEMRHVTGDRYTLAQPHGAYGTAVAVVRSADGKVTHITHGNRAFRKER